MPRFVLLIAGLSALLLLLIVIMAILGHKPAKVIQQGPNIPISSLVPAAQGPTLDETPAPVTNAQSFAVTDVSPANNSTNVALNSPITFNFNRNFESETALVKFNPDTPFDFSANSTSITVVPNPGLNPGTKYTVTVTVPGQNYSYAVTFTTVNPTNIQTPSPTPTDTSSPSPSPSSSPTS